MNTTLYKDNDNISESFLKRYAIQHNDKLQAITSNQFLADTFHDTICPLTFVNVDKVLKKQSNFEDNLLKCSISNPTSTSNNMKNVAEKFTEFVYADIDGNKSSQIEEKMNSEVFIVDSFSGNYQINGINNLFDCTGSQSSDTVVKRFKSYHDSSPSKLHSLKLNCDKILFKYLKRHDDSVASSTAVFSYELSDTNYENFVELFWKKLIETVKEILQKDATILNLNKGYSEDFIDKAIKKLEEFKFEFTDGILYLKDKTDSVKKAKWVPSQKSLALKILEISKENKLLFPNVLPRDGENTTEQTNCIEAIESYFTDSNFNIQILVLSLCKFLGDTSHIVVAYILLSEITQDKTLSKLKINLQLSERPMLIRNCLPDSDILKLFNIEKEKDLNNLIILVKKLKTINEMIESRTSIEEDNKKCWCYIRDTEYQKTKNIELIKKICENIDTKTTNNIDDNKKFQNILRDYKIDKTDNTYSIANVSDINDINDINDKANEIIEKLQNFYDYILAKKFIDENKTNIVKTIIKANVILTKIASKLNNLIMKIFTKRGVSDNDKVIIWRQLISKISNPELEYFENIIKYNECIKLLKSSIYLNKDNPINVKYVTFEYIDLSQNMYFSNAIKNENAEDIGVNFTSEDSTSNVSKLQNVLQYYLNIVSEDTSVGNETRLSSLHRGGGDDTGDVQLISVKKFFELCIDNLLIKIKNYIITSYYNYDFNNENLMLYINYIIEITIIYKLSENINLYFYCDFDYINKMIKTLFPEKIKTLFLNLDNKFKQDLNSLIKEKILLYLELHEKDANKYIQINEDYEIYKLSEYMNKEEEVVREMGTLDTRMARTWAARTAKIAKMQMAKIAKTQAAKIAKTPAAKIAKMRTAKIANTKVARAAAKAVARAATRMETMVAPKLNVHTILPESEISLKRKWEDEGKGLTKKRKKRNKKIQTLKKNLKKQIQKLKENFEKQVKKIKLNPRKNKKTPKNKQRKRLFPINTIKRKEKK